MQPIVFFDSGIGGLPYYRAFHRRNPNEAVVYVADRAGFPYGTKTKDELEHLLVDLAGALISRFKPKLMVAACNTASVSALSVLRETFPALSFVGTVPAIKPAVLASRKRRVGVLGTDRTVDDPYIAELAAKYGADAVVTCIAAPDIVDFVETASELVIDTTSGTAPCGAEAEQVIKPYIEQFRKKGADALVLGCTHFLLLLDVFKKLAAPDITIYDSVVGISRRIETLLDEKRLRNDGHLGGNTDGNANLLLVTGAAPIESVWYKRGAAFGLQILCEQY